MAVGLLQRARTGAIDHARDAGFGVQAHVGVQRRADRRDRFTEDLLAIALQRIHQELKGRAGIEPAVEQKYRRQGF